MKITRWRLWAGCLAVCVITVLVLSAVLRRNNRQLNLLLITLDTSRADRFGAYGYPSAETPHLDRLAKRGIVFERAYAPVPMTAPSHTSMFTGLWPPEHGVYTNGQTILNPGIPTLAELLERRGYDTAAFVASFVLHSKFGLNRGFRVYDDDVSTAKANSDELHRARDGRFVVDSTIRWLIHHHQERSKQPFFCWVHLYDPHEPYRDHSDEYGDRFAGRPYDAEIAYTDQLVGRLLEAIEKHGLTKNTYIVVVGDHGESLGEHGELTHGYMLHESTLRVPLIISDPRLDTAARRIVTPIPLIDVFPTLLEAAGAQVPNGTSGQSLPTATSSGRLAPRVCYSQTDEPYLQALWSPLRGLTTEHWRYVRTTKPELYDLIADPKELVNLATSQPDIVQQLDGELASFEEKLHLHTGAQVALSAREQRALESLGYTGGRMGHTATSTANESRPDIKDMIAYLNRLDEGLHLIDERNFDDAAVLLEALTHDVPKLLRARLNLGLCRLMRQNYAAAARELEAALEIDPQCDRAHDMLGFCYLKLGKFDLAKQHLKQLLELRPDSLTGHLFLGEVYQKQGDFPAAMQHYAIVLKINPNHAAARESLEMLRQALSSP